MLIVDCEDYYIICIITAIFQTFLKNCSIIGWKGHHLLADSQYGFRTNQSTTLSIIKAVEEITNSIDQKTYSVGLFIDFKKAFDTIDHTILVNKLKMYGIRRVVLNSLRSYFNGVCEVFTNFHLPA